jgi:pimeloyl-ACP methyl ester carboxylesterase
MHISPLTRLLNKTIRSFIFGFYRLTFGVGARIAPAHTAARGAALFNTPLRPKAEKLEAPPEIARPLLQMMNLPSGAVTVYEWGNPATLPTVLMLHGWSGWAMQFAEFVPALRAAGFAVVALDQAGHGRSPGRSSSLPMFIDISGEMLAHLPNLCGIIAHSMGAAAAVCALAASGERSIGLVLIAPPQGPRVFLEQFARMMGMPPALADGMQAWIERRYGRSFKSVGVEAVAPKLLAPSLILHDPADTVVPVEHGESYLRLAPAARLEALGGWGHYKILRAPDAVRMAVGFISLQAAQRMGLQQASA